MRHLLTLADYAVPDLVGFLQRASYWKRMVQSGGRPLPATPFAGKTLAIMFGKRSTRTRLAAETGFAYMGGHPLFLGKDDIQLGVNESIRDTAQVVSSMADMLLYRGDRHGDLELLAHHSKVPVINALTDTFHPTQILADLLTMHETFPGTAGSGAFHADSLRGLNVAWVGDTNNVLFSLMVTCPRLGIHLRVSTPRGYSIPDAVSERIQHHSATPIYYTHDPEDAVRKANIIITDTWISMGQEAEKEKRLRDFAGYQVTEELAQRGGADPQWKFMHCLPRKPQEVDDAVFYHPQRSLVFSEAENRKYAMMAVFDVLLRTEAAS